MLPLKLSIYGDFYDCQIYRGRLYLWTFDGQINTYYWSKIIEKFLNKGLNELALTYGFLNCRSLYSPDFNFIFKDKDFYHLLIQKFEQLSNQHLFIDERDIQDCLLGQQDVLNNCLPIDTEIYDSKLYYAIDDGLYRASVHQQTVKPISNRPVKMWSSRLLSLKSNSFGQLSLSAGSDGLFEYNAYSDNFFPDPSLKQIESRIVQITDQHSQFSNYSKISIYNSTRVAQSGMAVFEWKKNDPEKAVYGRKSYKRSFAELVPESSIFKKNGKSNLSWGFGDKIYRETDKGLDIVRFNNYPKEPEQSRFQFLRTIAIESEMGEIIAGGVAYFGTILEFERGLLVELSNGQRLEINEPITKWRIYPRAKNFDNQLHVILEDRIDILSFYHDFFLDQSSKLFGAELDLKFLDKEKVSSF